MNIFSEQVSGELKRVSEMLGVSQDALLRLLLRLPASESGPLPESQPTPVPASGALRTREGVRLPWGLELRKVFKGKEYRAKVHPAGIRVADIDGCFMSPSLAGIAVTGYNTNGWVFWEYFDQKDQAWKSLNELRKQIS